MKESSFELASRLRMEAEALEELFLDSDKPHTFRSRQEEETRLDGLLNLAQNRLASLRLEALQESMEDVDNILRKLRDDEKERSENGKPLGLIQSFISIAESEKVRLHHIITAAVRAEEESRRLGMRKPSSQPRPRHIEQTVEGQPVINRKLKKKEPEIAKTSRDG